MKLNKILCVIIALFAINRAVHAVEISVGGSLAGGFPIVRGKDYSDRFKGFMELGYKYKRCRMPFTLAPQFDVMFQFIPYLALETGLGFKYSTEQLAFHNGPGSSKPGGSDNNFYIWKRSQVYIPIMLRGQYEYKIGATYFSAGVKLGFPVVEDYISEGHTDSVWNEVNQVKSNYKSALFVLDIALSLGQEFKIATSHYLGFRINYDINVLSPYATSSIDDYKADTMLDDTDLFHDDLTIALTYRYAFGRDKE